jgi:DNA-binding beta-propeller fold protein YncE
MRIIGNSAHRARTGAATIVLCTTLALVACGSADTEVPVGEIATGAVPAAAIGPQTDAGPAASHDAASDFEVWVLDQGINLLWIYDTDLEQIATIDLAAHGAHMPHMIDFTSDFAYAFIANMHSNDVTVMRAADREVIATIDTGPATHMAGVSPDDRRVLVDVIGTPDTFRDGEVVELVLDLEAEHFAIGRRLRLADAPLLIERGDEFNDFSPICHKYSSDGRYAFITLGPSLDNGGLVVLDTESFDVVKAWSPHEIQANCGTMPTRDGRFMFINGGGPNTGVWYVIDMATLEIVHEGESRGLDAHGVWPTPDGREMWMVNRISDNAIIIGTETFEIIDEIEFVGETPDIMGMSPDGGFAFITLRGPNPMSAPHVAVGQTPGFAVVNVPERRLERVIEPAKGNARSDPHGIAVRALAGGSH